MKKYMHDHSQIHYIKTSYGIAYIGNLTLYIFNNLNLYSSRNTAFLISKNLEWALSRFFRWG